MRVGVCARCGESFAPAQMGAPCPNCGSPDKILYAEDQAVADERAAAARILAEKHYQVEDGLTQIFRITDKAGLEAGRNEPIKLLLVNENTVESGVMPLHFGPLPAIGIPYPLILVEATPNEAQKIQSHELEHPEGWEIGEELRARNGFCD
jgi:predicted  nucleic acid-binding Zn-ribbon protein